MRQHYFSPRAQRDLQNQIDYLIERDAIDPAESLLRRVEEFVSLHLDSFPRTGEFVEHRGLWETWIPGTKFVLWYRFDDSELEIVRLWHTSQARDRSPT